MSRSRDAIVKLGIHKAKVKHIVQVDFSRFRLSRVPAHNILSHQLTLLGYALSIAAATIMLP